MPIPKTQDVGKLMHFLKKDRPGDSQKQRVAIALSIARRNGADIKKPEEKKASFKDVKDIYDSLPEEQKRHLSPRGHFIDSPFLTLRAVSPGKEGFAEAYKLNGKSNNKSFVTIGVRQEAQGKGLAKKLMKQLIADARKNNIKELIYRAANDNEPSQRLATFFAGQPTRVMKESSEWRIKVPKGKKDKIFDSIVGRYKNKYGVDLSHMAMAPTTKAIFSDTTVNPDIPEDEVGGSWARNNTVYIGKNLDSVVKKYGLDMSPEDFKKHIIAHELAHEVHSTANKDFIRSILDSAKKEKFTTPYLDSFKGDPKKKDEETFAEYLARQVNSDSE